MRYRGQNRRKNGNSADSQLKKRSLKGHIGTENIGKYHKIHISSEKQNGIGSHIARGLRQETQRKTQETEKKAGMPQLRTARSAWNRTDDNGPFARKDAKQRKEKAHLIN